MDPLEFINIKRAKNAQRPLDPNRPAGQVEPWTRFDIEHEALALGWKPPIGYQLAPDPRSLIADPMAWWREFLVRYYIPGPGPGNGILSVSSSSGIKIGDMLKDADFEISSSAVTWPTDNMWDDRSPERYRECAIGMVHMIENWAGRFSTKVTWPLSEGHKSRILDLLTEAFGASMKPRNPQAMPPA